MIPRAFLIAILAIAGLFAFPLQEASAQYGFRGFGGFGFRGLIGNRVVQNNLNQQALRQIALQNQRQQFVVRQPVIRRQAFVGSFGSSHLNNGIVPGRSAFIVNGQRSIVAIDDQRGTFVRSGGVLVRVR